MALSKRLSRGYLRCLGWSGPCGSCLTPPSGKLVGLLVAPLVAETIRRSPPRDSQKPCICCSRLQPSNTLLRPVVHTKLLHLCVLGVLWNASRPRLVFLRYVTSACSLLSSPPVKPSTIALLSRVLCNIVAFFFLFVASIFVWWYHGGEISQLVEAEVSEQDVT